MPNERRNPSFPGWASAAFASLFILVTIIIVASSTRLFLLELRNARSDVDRTLDRGVGGLSEAIEANEVAAMKLIATRLGEDTRMSRFVVFNGNSRKLFEFDNENNHKASLGALYAWIPNSVSSFTASRSVMLRSGAVSLLRVDYFIASLATTFAWIVLTALLALGVTTLLIWHIYRRASVALTLPAHAIELVSEQITRTGDMSLRLPQLGSSDVGRLQETVNRLLDQLDQREKKKSLYSARLEGDVATRTKALADSNEQLRRLAYLSSETSLPNRAAFLDRIHKLSVVPLSPDVALGLFVVRIARVRYANEAFGFDVGDLMIESAARNLSAICASDSELFHLGGGEFAVVRMDVEEHMHDVANEILRVDDVVFVYRGATLNLQPKVGYAVFPTDASGVDDLTRFAMLALNAATAHDAPVSTVRFSPNLLEETVVIVQIEAAIKRAVDTGQFEPHFQSRVDTETGRVHGLEALIRWTSPELSGYNNYQLIPIAERSLLATELDSQMLRKVVQWLAALAADGIRIPVAVNLSSRSLQRAAFPDEIRALVQSHGVDIKQIELELTESVLIEKNDVVGRNVASLHEMGVRLLLADFGSGYSSLRYLRELPIAIVKIDRTFIQTLPDDAPSLAIVESTIDLVHRLGKRVVAEGVETYAQWETLRSLGCDEVQGYFFMRPQGPKVVAEMLRQQFDATVGHLTIDLTNFDKSDDFSFSTLGHTAQSG